MFVCLLFSVVCVYKEGLSNRASTLIYHLNLSSEYMANDRRDGIHLIAVDAFPHNIKPYIAKPVSRSSELSDLKFERLY